MLKNYEVKPKIHKTYHLFPTIERMGTSPNALKLRFLFRIMFIIQALLRFLQMLPGMFTTLLCYAYFAIVGYPKQYLGTAMKFLRPKTFECSMFLANDEFKRVVNLDMNNLVENKRLIKMYYGQTDGWTPVQYYRDLKSKIPDIDAELDSYDMSHAFMMSYKADQKMATLLSEWIRGRFE